MGVIPNRELFMEFQLGPTPTAFFDSENQNLHDATQTLQDNFNRHYLWIESSVLFWRLIPT